MKNVITLITLLVFTVTYAQPNMSRYRQHQLTSTIFDTIRDITVLVPANYDREPNKKYEVLYVLDAQNDRLFNLTTSMADYLDGNDFIPTIIVGIKSKDRWNEFLAKPKHQETYNMVLGYFGKNYKFGNADMLADYLQKEIFPFIEKTYRTLPRRIAAGHSLGGTFLTYCAVTRPQMFDATLCISPNLAFDKESMLEKVIAFKNTEAGINAYNFIAYGRIDSYETQFYPSTQKAIAAFESYRKNGVLFNHKEFADANHASILAYGLAAGITGYFDTMYLTAPNVIANYEALLKQKAIMLTADDANNLAYNCFWHDKVDDAIQVMDWAIGKFPADSNLHDSMGEFYENKKDNAQAVKYYQQALNLLKKSKASMDKNTYDEKLDYFSKNLKRVQGK